MKEQVCFTDSNTEQRKFSNCWEVNLCGREPGGKNVDTHGVCPAAMPGECDGTNGGKYGGRFCWSIAGSMSGRDPVGTCAKAVTSCLECNFFLEVAVYQEVERLYP